MRLLTSLASLLCLKLLALKQWTNLASWSDEWGCHGLAKRVGDSVAPDLLSDSSAPCMVFFVCWMSTFVLLICALWWLSSFNVALTSGGVGDPLALLLCIAPLHCSFKKCRAGHQCMVGVSRPCQDMLFGLENIKCYCCMLAGLRRHDNVQHSDRWSPHSTAYPLWLPHYLFKWGTAGCYQGYSVTPFFFCSTNNWNRIRCSSSWWLVMHFIRETIPFSSSPHISYCCSMFLTFLADNGWPANLPLIAYWCCNVCKRIPLLVECRLHCHSLHHV